MSDQCQIHITICISGKNWRAQQSSNRRSADRASAREMNMVIELEASERWRWVERDGVVAFEVNDNGQPVDCRISHECISDHLGDQGAGAVSLAVAKEHFESITDIVSALIARGRYEPDGSILIRTEDWHHRPTDVPT